jgi:hypothetical protein
MKAADILMAKKQKERGRGWDQNISFKGIPHPRSDLLPPTRGSP